MEESKNTDDMLVFGYGSKLFRDDEKALWIDSKQHLVPWNGMKSLMIDRFDVRGLLLDQRDFDADFVPHDRRSISADEMTMEKLCDEERYLALNKDLQAEKEREEEEWKRYQEALQEGFHAIGHEYETKEYDPMEPTEDEYPDTINLDEHVNGVSVSHISREEQKYAPQAEQEQESSEPSEETEGESSEDRQPYVIPRGLIIPHDMHLPETAKLGVVIEKTAQLVATQGAQMEVLLKTKQSNNASFQFLNFNSILHPFYMFILTMIKSRRYTPQPQPVVQPSTSAIHPPPPPIGSAVTSLVHQSNSSSSNSYQIAKSVPKASVVIDHSNKDGDKSDESDSDSDSDSDSSSSGGGGYLHPLLAGGSLSPVTSSSANQKSIKVNNNNNQSESKDDKNESRETSIATKDKTKDAESKKSQADEIERSRRDGVMQQCHQRALTRLYYDGLSHVPVVPPAPDRQPAVDRLAKEVAQQPDPNAYEEGLRQAQIEAMKDQTADSAQEYIEKRFLWPQDSNHVYYRFKKYYFLECLSLLGCCDPQEEWRKKEEARVELEQRKAAAEAKAAASQQNNSRKRPSSTLPGPIKFSISPGAKKLKGGGGELLSKESALPYESSDSGEENEETEAAENILQDEEEEEKSTEVDSSKFKPIASSNSDKNVKEETSQSEQGSAYENDPDAAIRAMTAFLSELEARNPDPFGRSDHHKGNSSSSNNSQPQSNEQDQAPMSEYEKALQAERKRKASMFLMRLKKNNEIPATSKPKIANEISESSGDSSLNDYNEPNTELEKSDLQPAEDI